MFSKLKFCYFLLLFSIVSPSFLTMTSFAADQITLTAEPVEVPEVDESAPNAAKAGIEPPAAPTIRKLARELGIDLRRLRGSERGGRIVMADIRGYIQRLEKLALTAKPGSQKPGAVSAAEGIEFSKWGPVTKKPLTPLRQTISRRITDNWNAIPHVTQFDEADITALTELRKRFAGEYDAKGTKLTLTPLTLRSTRVRSCPAIGVNPPAVLIASRTVRRDSVGMG